MGDFRNLVSGIAASEHYHPYFASDVMYGPAGAAVSLSPSIFNTLERKLGVSMGSVAHSILSNRAHTKCVEVPPEIFQAVFSGPGPSGGLCSFRVGDSSFPLSFAH